MSVIEDHAKRCLKNQCTLEIIKRISLLNVKAILWPQIPKRKQRDMYGQGTKMTLNSDKNKNWDQIGSTYNIAVISFR